MNIKDTEILLISADCRKILVGWFKIAFSFHYEFLLDYF